MDPPAENRMNRALVTLLKLNYKATVRRALRGVRTWRGAFLLLFTLGFIALMVGPQVFMATAMKGRPEARQFSDLAEPLAPLGLLGFTLLFVFTSAGEAAVAFTPAEVDLLFAAPFTRRELLLYKLAKTGLALIFVSAFMSMTTLVYLRSWLSGFVGFLLATAMMQLMGMVTALAGQIVAESVYTRVRKAVALAVAVVAMGGLAQAAGKVQAEGLAGILMALRESPVFRAVLAPFEVFTNTVFAERWFPDLVGWGAGALAIDLVLLAIVLKLDANYLETAATISQKVYERIRRSKQGGGIAMPVGAGAGRLRLPGLPWLGGAGPVAWRQLLIVLRTSRHLLFTSMLVVGMVAAGLLFVAGGGSRTAGSFLCALVRHRDDVLHDVPLLDAAPVGLPGRSRPHRVLEDPAARSHVPGGRRAGRRRADVDRDPAHAVRHPRGRDAGGVAPDAGRRRLLPAVQRPDARAEQLPVLALPGAEPDGDDVRFPDVRQDDALLLPPDRAARAPAGDPRGDGGCGLLPGGLLVAGVRRDRLAAARRRVAAARPGRRLGVCSVRCQHADPGLRSVDGVRSGFRPVGSSIRIRHS